MSWTIQRFSGGPGPHTIGPETVQFNAEGLCVTEHEAVAERAKLFPEAFLVTETPASPAEALPAPLGPTPRPAEPHALPGPYTQASLEAMPMAEIRSIMRTQDLPSSRATKEEMIALILENQEPEAP